MVMETVRYDEPMGISDELRNASEYGTAELNDRGRLTIPKELREDLQLEDGTEFAVIREGGDIRLIRQLPALETLTRDEEWGEEAFRDAGEATFGGS